MAIEELLLTGCRVEITGDGERSSSLFQD